MLRWNNLFKKKKKDKKKKKFVALLKVAFINKPLLEECKIHLGSYLISVILQGGSCVLIVSQQTMQITC